MFVSNTPSTGHRGAFIVLEGVDRCGKTTQSGLLRQRMAADGNVTALRFPNRTTEIGQLINAYLQSSQNLDDRAVHLLFSANRWEASSEIGASLQRGQSIVCDRYAYSGVAFSSAKIDDKGKPILSMEWCQAPDKGLPAPDCVIFLDLSQDEAEKRGGYGGERYEQRDMQVRVRQRFAELEKLDQGRVPWARIDAAQSVEQVHEDIWRVVQATLEDVAKGKPLARMWQDGAFDLQKYAQEKEN